MNNYEGQLQIWIETGRLVRIVRLKERGQKQILLGRILSLDLQLQHLIFYHADEKKVYNILLNEIEEVVAV
jgi:hypothetical protein